MVCRNANTTRNLVPTTVSTVGGGALTATILSVNPLVLRSPVHASAAPARISAGTASTQATCTARNPARAFVGRRRAHSHRKINGTTLCRWASTTKWYAGQRRLAPTATTSAASTRYRALLVATKAAAASTA